MVTRSLLCAALLCAVPLHAFGDTLTACEQSIDYTVQAPGADVPEAMRSFSGVWIGKMNTGLCIAVIVQNIKPDGSAQFVYVNGSMGGQYPIKAGNRKINGKIGGGKLSASNQTVSQAYSLRGVSELDLTYTHNTAGQFQGSLKRQ